MTNELKDKICLVTGAAKGIGRAIAERLAQGGAIVYANDLPACDMSWTDVFDGDMRPLPFDICNFDEAKQAVLTIRKEQGRIDVLCNNAGLVSYEPMMLIDFEKMRRMMEVNVYALIHLMQLVSKLMIRQKSGSIVNMSSLVGVKGAGGQLAYSATKGAVAAITKSASKELAEQGIRVNAVAPGMVATERFMGEIAGRFEERLKSVRMGRFAEPDDVAEAFAFFASDRSKYITGQVLEVEGSFAI